MAHLLLYLRGEHNVVQAVVFDFDGVLVDSVHVKTEAFATLYAPYGNDVVQRVVAHHREHGGISRFEKFRLYHAQFLGIELLDAEVENLARQFSQLVEEHVIAAPYVDGAREVLEEYYPLVPLFVASGTPHIELQRIVAQRGMAHYFQAVFGSPTQKAEIIHSILGTYGFVAHEVLMVGDAMTDYHAAKATGLQFVGRLNDEHGAFPLGTTVIPTLCELPQYIDAGEDR